MKKAFITKEQVEKITKKHPTPFHIYDEKAIRENARNLKKAFSWNTNFREYFAVKANSNPVLMKILNEEGCGMDCSSYAELLLCEKLEIPGEDIFFSSNNTPAEEFKYAKKLGAHINLDDFTHIDFLEKTSGLPKEICLRFNPGNNFSISTPIMDNPTDAKYGFTYEQLIQIGRAHV